MRISDLDYELPASAIALRPAEPRDQSRLLVVRRGGGAGAERGAEGGALEHRRFYEISAFLQAGDLLVVNDTRVLPAKLSLRRKSGAVITGLFLAECGAGEWEVMLRTRGKAKEGEQLIGGRYSFRLEKRMGEGLWKAKVLPADPAGAVLAEIGQVPLPPYIEKGRKEANSEFRIQNSEWGGKDRQWYQTVYAHAAGAVAGGGGSVAAPTAGLHFTPELLRQLEEKGVRRAAVELQVGLGTFLPVEADTLEAHRMHVERYRVPAEAVRAIRAARRDGRRIVVVGTTAVRTLETTAAAILDESTAPADLRGLTDLKIAPGFAFRLTDLLVTNFHLPRSTLMSLVAAFLGEGGVERLKELYGLAVREGYRFYSYGDAMMIVP